MTTTFIKNYGVFIGSGFTHGVFMFCFLVLFYYYFAMPSAQKQMQLELSQVLDDDPSQPSDSNDEHNRELIREVMITIVILVMVDFCFLIWLHHQIPSLSVVQTVLKSILILCLVFAIRYAFHRRVVNRYQFV